MGILRSLLEVNSEDYGYVHRQPDPKVVQNLYHRLAASTKKDIRI